LASPTSLPPGKFLSSSVRNPAPPCPLHLSLTVEFLFIIFFFFFFLWDSDNEQQRNFGESLQSCKIAGFISRELIRVFVESSHEIQPRSHSAELLQSQDRVNAILDVNAKIQAKSTHPNQL
jgi:hypothetical protein